jgi:hypothetical protein
MDRRELIGFMSAGAAGIFAAGLGGAQTQVKQDDKLDEHLRIMGQCIRACNETARHCLDLLSKEDTTHREHHVRAQELTIDCQAFCVLTASLMARNSPLVVYAHQACAEACKTCAEECDKGQDEIMKQCAEKCRACEALCRRCGKTSS